MNNPATIQQLNFKVGNRSYGLRSAPRRQVIFVENLSGGEYQRISSYDVVENAQNVTCLDISKWVSAENNVHGHEQVLLYKKVNQFLDLFYMPN